MSSSGLIDAIDGDTDAIWLDPDTFTLKVIDDIPVDIRAETVTLENTQGAMDMDALNFFHNVGADEAGSVVFVDQIDGDDNFLKDTSGNLVTVNGSNIKLSGFGTTVLEGTAVNGPSPTDDVLVLRITLNPDAVTAGDGQIYRRAVRGSGRWEQRSHRNASRWRSE